SITRWTRMVGRRRLRNPHRCCCWPPAYSGSVDSAAGAKANGANDQPRLFAKFIALLNRGSTRGESRMPPYFICAYDSHRSHEHLRWPGNRGDICECEIGFPKTASENGLSS